MRQASIFKLRHYRIVRALDTGRSVAYLPWFWKYVMLIIFSAVYREEREALIQENIARMQAHMGAEGDLWQGMVVAGLPFPAD